MSAPISGHEHPLHPACDQLWDGCTLTLTFDDVIPALGLTVTEAVQQLGVDGSTLSRVIKGHAAISPEMALHIEAWLGKDRGSDAAVRLAEQSAYDPGRLNSTSRKYR